MTSHNQSPVASALVTYGASYTTAGFLRDTISSHSRTDAAITSSTTSMNTPATTASSRSLNMTRCAASTLAMLAGKLPLATADSMTRAWARNPSRGSLEKTFCQPAVMVTVTSQASGSSVTQAKRALPILMMTVVPTHNATAASS